MADVPSAPQTSRTGWAAIVAFVAFVLIYIVYFAIVAGIAILAARFDHSHAWQPMTNLAFIVITPMSSYCALKVSFRYFPQANREAVFYSIGTLLVVTGLLALRTEVVQPLIHTVLGVGGAWIATKV